MWRLSESNRPVGRYPQFRNNYSDTQYPTPVDTSQYGL